MTDQPAAEGASGQVRTLTLVPKPLRAFPFRNFGSVIEVGEEPGLMPFDDAGTGVIKIIEIEPRDRIVTELTRHNHTARLLVPMDKTPFAIAVGPKLDEMAGRSFPGANTIQAFHDEGVRGVLLAPGTWYELPFVKEASRWLSVAVEPKDHGQKDDLTRNYEEILRTNFRVEEPDPNAGVRLL